MQHEITSRAPLLDAAGKLREAGYAKRLLPVYDRAAIRAGAARIKEWDYYLVANDHYAVALTIDDNGYMDGSRRCTGSPTTMAPTICTTAWAWAGAWASRCRWSTTSPAAGGGRAAWRMGDKARLSAENPG